jgi:glycosyltransferase involved in cell wall biosynthesis
MSLESPAVDAPLVSIIINNYNYAGFLGAAIESALAQTYRPIEVIVVDDGSTDDSRAVIDSFGQRVRSVIKANGGQGSAYNAGFSVSRGRFIHYLDSDDLLEPDAIAEAVQRWEPGVAKVHFYLRVIEGAEGSATEALLPSGKLGTGDLRSSILKTGNYISPPSSGNLYTREVLAQLLPMPEKAWITAADLYCIFLSALLGEVRSVPHALGCYRVHGSNCDAQTIVTGKLLRYRLQKEMRRDAVLAEFCGTRGIRYQPGSVAKHIAHQKVRIASLVIEPREHPFREDRLARMVWLAIWLCWREKSFSLLKKLYFSAWFAALPAAPASYQVRLMELGFVPTSRPKILQRLLAHASVPLERSVC